jgi:aconitate hydratase
MIFDFELIKSFYNELSKGVSDTRKTLHRPLTLSEKILYNHLYNKNDIKVFKRGVDYIEFTPDRVAMQDATAQMALLQFMMAGKNESAVPATVHCDHLILAKSGADEDINLARVVNKEVYDFLSSVCNKYNIGFWKPGSGIIHQIILENYAFPGGMIIGTDSHTPNAGGLGMIAIGVGGADAVDVMSGMGWELKFPKLIGIKLTGKLNGWASAKDVILKITGLLTVKGGTGSIIEYFGDGAESLSCTGKATICNMGAETGATCSIFGFDNSMKEFLTATGREKLADLAYSNRADLVADPEVYRDPEKFYDQYFEIDLSEIEPYINGPFTPDIATPISKMKEELEKNGWPEKVEVGLIGSCTNSSYEDISRSASVAKNAFSENLITQAEFKISPGSEQVRAITERDGLLDDLRKIGGEIFANACGPCIGQWSRKGAEEKKVNSVIHSFNRNFSKRTDGNPNTHSFVASPEIVTAIAIAGKLSFNPITDTIKNKDGLEVKLKVPKGYELPPDGFGTTEKGLMKPDNKNKNVDIIISPDSERLQLLEPFPAWNGNDFLRLPLLIKVKGKCTTDHISMAGKWLKYRGHLENISENYMIGAVNSFNDQINSVLNRITGEYATVPDTAKLFRNTGSGSIVVGEDNFGEGSSREHAAMEPRYLGVKAILVKSFARIHETNLKKQGVLTLTFSDKNDYDKIKETDTFDITGLNNIVPDEALNIVLNHSDGTKEIIKANHSYNTTQIQWFKEGCALNIIKKQNKKNVG